MNHPPLIPHAIDSSPQLLFATLTHRVGVSGRALGDVRAGPVEVGLVLGSALFRLGRDNAAAARGRGEGALAHG